MDTAMDMTRSSDRDRSWLLTGHLSESAEES